MAVLEAMGLTAQPQQEGIAGMNAARSTGFRALTLATVAGLALSGAAMAQKPAPLGAPTGPALPSAKPPPLGAPQQAQPAPQRPAPPPAAQAPQAPPPAIAAPQAIPPNEPAAVTRLRGLFDAQTRLSYATVETLDGAGEQVRMTGVVLERPGKRATADEVSINGLRPDGVGEVVVRRLATTEAGNTVNIGRLRLAGLAIQRPASGGPPQPEQVTLDALQLSDLQVTGTTTVTLASLELEGWGCRPADPLRHGRAADRPARRGHRRWRAHRPPGHGRGRCGAHPRRGDAQRARRRAWSARRCWNCAASS